MSTFVNLVQKHGTDMSLHSNLQRRKTSYYFRQSVPSHLIPHIGKSEIVRSLKTTDPIIAKERCRQLALEVSGWFDSKILPMDNSLPDSLDTYNRLDMVIIIMAC